MKKKGYKKNITYKELLKMNEFENVNIASELSKLNFWYFTSFDTAEKIINNKYILLNNITNMNDIDERKRILDPDNVFVLCFCNSNKENIPMWYLYSGINGDGVSIGITPRNIIELKNNLEIYECNDKNEINYNRKIYEKDYILHCGFVYYEDHNNLITFRNSKYYIKDFNSENCFTKQYPWYYEKEFRIVIRLKRNRSKCKKIGIALNDDFIKNFRIRYAPEMSKFLKYKFISEPKHSELNIRMNLLDKNKKIIREYFENNYMDEKCRESIKFALNEIFKSNNKKNNRYKD